MPVKRIVSRNASQNQLHKRCPKCGHEYIGSVEWFAYEPANADYLSLLCKACLKEKRNAKQDRYKLSGKTDPRWGSLHLLFYYTHNRDNNNMIDEPMAYTATALGVTVYKIAMWQVELAQYGCLIRFRSNNNRRVQLLMYCFDGRHLREISTPQSRNKQIRELRENPDAFKQRTFNPTLERLTSYQYRRKHLPITMTDADWLYALEYWNYSCAVCGRPPGLWHTIAADHWIPVSSPDCPGTIPTNIIPLCHGIGGCNNAKSNHDPVEWVRSKLGKKASTKLTEISEYFDSLEDGDDE